MKPNVDAYADAYILAILKNTPTQTVMDLSVPEFIALATSILEKRCEAIASEHGGHMPIMMRKQRIKKVKTPDSAKRKSKKSDAPVESQQQIDGFVCVELFDDDEKEAQDESTL